MVWLFRKFIDKLDEYIVSNFSDKNVIILGDMNDDLTDPKDDNVF